MSHLHHDPQGHGPVHQHPRDHPHDHPHGVGASAGPVELQRWTWGEAFDVEIPSDWIVEPRAEGSREGIDALVDAPSDAAQAQPAHVHLVEIYPAAQASTVAHIALLEPAPPGDGPGGLADLIRTFAHARGAAAAVDVERAALAPATAGEPGPAMARATFDGEGGRWVVYVATWGAAGAWMTACGHADEAAHLDAARRIFESLTAREVLAPLAPEEDGSF